MINGPDARRNFAVWVPLVSSNLRAACFFRDHQGAYALDIRFRSGRIYRYHGVPEAVYRALLAAPSKGVYHDRNIKWSYPFTPL